MNVILINQNQTDARYELSEDGICQTLTARCGTGGGHVPMILMFDGEKRHNYEICNSGGCGIADTITASYWKGAGTRNGQEREFICYEREKVCIEKVDSSRMSPADGSS